MPYCLREVLKPQPYAQELGMHWLRSAVCLRGSAKQVEDNVQLVSTLRGVKATAAIYSTTAKG